MPSVYQSCYTTMIVHENDRPVNRFVQTFPLTYETLLPG